MSHNCQRSRIRPGYIDAVKTCRQKTLHPPRGFSSIEMLAVLGVIALMAALAVPSIIGMSGSAGRKGAVNVLLNTFEQARVAALTSGTTTYVGFANRYFPDENMQYRAYIVFRDRTEDDPAGAGEYIPLTRWETLPRNIYFHRETNSLVGRNGDAPSHVILTDNSLPRLYDGAELPVIRFNSMGGIIEPTTSNHLRLFITERDPMSDGPGGFLEQISFARFTGRATLDVTSLGN